MYAIFDKDDEQFYSGTTGTGKYAEWVADPSDAFLFETRKAAQDQMSAHTRSGIFSGDLTIKRVPR